MLICRKFQRQSWGSQIRVVKLSHRRVFDCVTHVNISNQGRNKLDPKSKKRTIIVYGEDEFDYRLWDGENKNMIHNRDVTLNERVMYIYMHNTKPNDSKLSDIVYARVDGVPKSLTFESSQL